MTFFFREDILINVEERMNVIQVYNDIGVSKWLHTFKLMECFVLRFVSPV